MWAPVEACVHGAMFCRLPDSITASPPTVVRVFQYSVRKVAELGKTRLPLRTSRTSLVAATTLKSVLKELAERLVFLATPSTWESCHSSW